ncbi:unnamed protein product [Ilex paraguariensis]|uniref:Uncharacterized protein n=1 Tax=Ilex paraguariensis TaxID=185542 RepID=A0ABC8SU69_9AQUA
MNDILKLGGFNLDELDVLVEEEIIDDVLGIVSQQALLDVRIGRLEVVADRIEKKFDTFASQCTTSFSVMEKRLGEIGHILSQFVNKSTTTKDVPHDTGGNNGDDEIDLTKADLDDPQAAKGHQAEEMAGVVFPRITHINDNVEPAIYIYIFDKNLPSEYVMLYPIFEAISYA